MRQIIYDKVKHIADKYKKAALCWTAFLYIQIFSFLPAVHA